MAQLFGRQIKVVLGRSGAGGREITDLRMAAKIELSRTSTPNPSRVQIWNPRQDTVESMQRPDSVIEVYAGYSSPILIARGNPIKDGVTEEKSGPTRILTIEFSDGGQAFAAARVNRTFAANATLQQIFTECTNALGLPLGAATVDLSTRLPYGFTATGQASTVMDKIVNSIGANWFIRDGVVQIVPVGESTGEPAVLFASRLKNLIGEPRKKSGGKIEITALVNPGIRPGKPFRVESRDVNRDYIADDVTFMVDNWQGGDFIVRIVGRER